MSGASANISGFMANLEHLAILKQGAKAWNQWRGVSSAIAEGFGIIYPPPPTETVYPNLAGADLSELDLTEANFSFTNLRHANLSGACLVSANLCDAHCGHVNFAEANMSFAKFGGTILRKANFTNSIVGDTIFANVDLCSVRGLDSIHHLGPSTIGIDTLVRSKAAIPERFLRGAGVPDSFIANSLVGSTIEFYSCFISYSTCDQEFADRVCADLQAKGVRCWFARHHVKGGRKLHEQIDQAIRVHEKLVVILSASSMTSEWVRTEISKARKREVRERQHVLFPICLVPFDKIREWECFDADTGKDSAREIREYFIPDFSNWKDHDSYQTAFERLLRDLQAASKGNATV